jgi:hypothetical protein
MFIKTVKLSALLPGLVLAAFPSTVVSSNFASLKGSWSCEEEGSRYTLEFKTEKLLTYDGQSLSYQLQDNILFVEEEYGFNPYMFELKETGLTILSPDGSVSRCQQGGTVKTTKPEKKPLATKAPTDAKTLVPGKNWPAYTRPTGDVSWESSDPHALLYKFAGRWDTYSGSTLTNIYLKPDGSYEDSSETSYSGTFSDSGGYQTGAWGTVGQNQNSGSWTIKGTLSSGVITLVSNNGQRNVINYQVHMKNGEYYGGEYFFNGALHSVNYIYR